MPDRLTSPRTIGRERELAAIAMTLARAADGRTGTLLLAGPGGIGTSRLVDEATARLGRVEEPFLVARGTALAGDPAPYAPVIGALRGVLAALDPDARARVLGPAAETLSVLLPDLTAHGSTRTTGRRRPTTTAARQGVAAGATTVAGGLPSIGRLTVSPEHRQAHLLEALIGVLDRLGRIAPVVLALEDLHAADAATRALVVFLTRVERSGRFCLIGTYQPDAITHEHPFRHDLAALDETPGRASVVEVGPLGRPALLELIAAIEGERPGGAVLLLVAERSGGNPLIAEEVLAARREVSDVTVAGPFDRLVAARLAVRSAGCRRLLRILARAGIPLSTDELGAVIAREAGVVAAHGERRRDPTLGTLLAEALGSGFVVRDGEGPVRIRHELVAEAIVADLLPGDRRRLDLAIAAGLGEERPAARLVRSLAGHDPSLARAAALDLADLAATRYAPDDELAALERAIELGAGRPTAADASARALAARAAEAAFAAERPGRSVAYAEAAIAASAAPDAPDSGLLHERLGIFRRVAGEIDGSLGALERAVALVPDEPTPDRARVIAHLAQSLMLHGRFADAARHAERALATARAAGARHEESHALCTLGVCRAWGDRPEESIPHLEAALAIAEELGSAEDRFRAVANLTTALDLLGRQDDAIAIADAGIDWMRRTGLETVYGNVLRGNVATILFNAGRWEEARAMCVTALEWSRTGPSVLDAEASLASIEVESRADEAAARRLGRLLLTLETRPDAQDVGPVTRAAASFALWRGDAADALRVAERGWTLAAGTEDWALIAEMAATYLEVLAANAAEGRARRDLGATASARAAAAAALRTAMESADRAGAATATGPRRRLEANLATARAHGLRVEGRDDAARWAEVAALWDAAGDPYRGAKARYEQAASLLGAHDARTGRPLARGPLLEAEAIARRLGARPLRRVISELAERALITLPEPGPGWTDGADGRTPTGVPIESGDGVLAAAETGGVAAAVLAGATGNGRSRGATEALTRGAPSGALASYGSRATGSTTAERALGRRGGEVRDAFAERTLRSGADLFELSRREREVLGLIVRGLTNREIGERLFISQKTVGVHVGNVLAKMRVSGRVEAATLALRLGIVQD